MLTMRNALALVTFAAVCALTTTPAPAQTRNYDLLLGPGKAGFETVTVHAGLHEVHYEYNDRGRGPKLDSTIHVDEHSIPVSLRTTGVDYYKTPVTESFDTNAGRAAWSNGSEKDSAPAGSGFYLSMYGAPEENALLARALLSAPEHRLYLLPAGEAALRKLGDTTVVSGDNKQHVTCYEVAGLGFVPDPLWLDDDNELFASVSSWSSLIREGWDSSAKTLLDAQKRWRDESNHAMTKRLMHDEGPRIAIRNVAIFDPKTMKTSAPDRMVTIRGNRIERVGPVTTTDAYTIDGQGRVLMPGLWDMHQHFSEVDGLLDIANGVTGARDLGNDVEFIAELKKKFESNELIGPRIVLAALIDGTSPYTGPTKLIVDSEADARRVIDRVAPLGFEQTKIYSSIKPELVPFIAKVSHEHHMRVSGHIPAGMTAAEAVRAGYDEIQHANMLMLNFMPDVKETRTPARFTAVAERGAALDLRSEEVKKFIALLRQHKTVIDPTLNIFENLFTARRGEIDPSYAMIANRLPPQVRRGFLTGGLAVPEGMDRRYRDSFAKMLGLVKLMYDGGITVVAGTDTLAGFALHRELELYVKAGIPAPAVLRIATLGAATVARREQELGTIEQGKLADMVLIDGNPAKNISDIRKVALVIKDGKVFDPREIERELGVQSPANPGD